MKSSEIFLVIPLLAGMANLIFPRRVMNVCEWFDRLVPIRNRNFFKDAGENFYRVSGAIAIAICVVILAYDLFS